MQRQTSMPAFGEEHAASYDAKFAKLSPMKDALHLCMRGVLAELPPDARILCVGAGTGAELLYLADAFPGWHFVLVEPAAAMLSRCRARAVEAGIDARCVFHEGYLDSLGAMAPFDAATAILVSQFVLELEQRRAFFAEIAKRLKTGGILIDADLAGGPAADPADEVFAAWLQLMHYNGLSHEGIEQYRNALEKGVAVCRPEEVEALIASGGFEAPVRFCQTLLIHAWHARRKD